MAIELRRMGARVGTAVKAGLLAIGLVGPGAASAGQISLAPVDDALVNSTKPADLYGLTHHLSVYFDGAVYNRSYLKFDLAGIPDDAVVTSARLLLYPFFMSELAPAVDVHHVADDSWQESTLVWTNRPGFGARLAGSAPALDIWQSFDLLAGGAWDYAADLADGYLSLLLKEGEPLTQTVKRVSYSPAEQHSYYVYQPPSLEITWRTVPEPAGPALFALALIALAALRRGQSPA